MPYKNDDLRKQKSKEAARKRRSHELVLFSELNKLLPLPLSVVDNMDRMTLVRVAISHIKLRRILGNLEDQGRSEMEMQLDKSYSDSLPGILLVVTKEGDLIYLTNNTSAYLGISQLEMLGQNLYDLTHPTDHNNIRDMLDKLDMKESEGKHHDFFLRMKCTLSKNGKNMALKTASYKVLHCKGKCVTVGEPEDAQKPISCMIFVAEPIPHAADIQTFLDSSTYLTKHGLDMTTTVCDDKLCELLGYSKEEMMSRPMYHFYHPEDTLNLSDKFKQLKEFGQINTGIYRLLAKHGGYVYMTTEATVIYNHGGNKEQPEHIVCLNYANSCLENGDQILADFQMASYNDLTSAAAVDIGASTVAMSTDDQIANAIFSTTSVFATLNTDDVITASDDFTDTPSPEDVLVALNFPDQNPKLVGVESLLHPSLDPASGELLQQSHTPDLLDDTTCSSTMAPPSSLSGSQDSLYEISDSDSDSIAQTQIVESIKKPELVDMAQRAPYIEFDMDTKIVSSAQAAKAEVAQDLSVGANVMIGKTESVWRALEDVEDEDGDEEMGRHSSLRFMRQETSNNKKRDHDQIQRKTSVNINTSTETNRLETGPPSKRNKLSSSPDGGESSMDVPEDYSILMSLLQNGRDQYHGYSLHSPKSLSPSPMSSPTSTLSSPLYEDKPNILRNLLTSPMSPLGSSSSSGSPSPPSSPDVFPHSVLFPTDTAGQHELFPDMTSAAVVLPTQDSTASQPQIMYINPAFIKILGPKKTLVSISSDSL